MDSISDPARAGRRDRRRAQRLIDTAFAERRLTAADRTLRTERIRAAATRGDLAMITRDLGLPATAHLGTALDPTQLSSMRVGPTSSTTRTWGTVAGRPVGSTGHLATNGRRVRLIVIITAAALLGSCLLGLLAIVAPLVSGFRSGLHGASHPTSITPPVLPPTPVFSTPPGPEPSSGTASLHSAAGWSSFVAAVKDASGSTKVYDLVVYPTYASVGLDVKDGIERRLWRDGGWQDMATVRTAKVGTPVDIGGIDPAVITGLDDATAKHFHIDDPSGSYYVVMAFADVPQILVYVQSGGSSQYRAYGLDGHPLS